MGRFNLEDYEPVEQRIKRFYGDYEHGRIATELVDSAGDVGKTRWIMKAAVYTDKDDQFPRGTGFAFEVDGSGMANNTSALENCETSAVGRALANAGYSGDKRATREEMAKVAREEAQAAVKKKVTEMTVLVRQVQSSDELRSLWSEAKSGNFLTDELKKAMTDRGKELENA